MRVIAIMPLLTGLTAIGCAHGSAAGRAVEVSWNVCAVTTAPNGDDIDDGGVDVAATITQRDQQTRIDAGHYPGQCWREPGAVSRLVCRDPHVDIRYVLQWTRSSPSSLSVERLEYAVSAEDGVPDPTTPQQRRLLRTVTVPPDARVVAARPGCKKG